MSEIRFDESSHKYYAGERELPGVSFLLEQTGLKAAQFKIDPFYAIRGRFIHKACHLDWQGKLDDATIDPQIEGYIRAWRTFRSLSCALIHSMETVVYSEEWQYCGTYDFLGWINNDHAPLTLLDIKSGGPASWHIYQLAAYILASQGERWDACRVGNLYLRANGTFDLRMYQYSVTARAVAEWKAKLREYYGRRQIEWR